MSAVGRARAVARAQHAAALAGAGCCWPAIVLVVVSERRRAPISDLQLATGAYYFAVLAGLTVLAGQSGQISLGHGALMAVGAYTVALLIGNEGWALVPAIVAAVAGHRAGRDPGRRGGQPAARPLPGRGDAGLRGRAAGARRQVPGHVRRRERTDDQPAGAALVPGRELPARALGGVDRLRRSAGGAVRALQPHRQRRGAGAAGGTRRRDRGLAVRTAVGRHADAGVRGQRRLRGPGRRAAGRRAAARRSPARSRFSSRSRCSPAWCSAASDRWWARSGEPRCSRCCPTGPTIWRNSFSLSTKVSANLPLAIYGIVLIAAMILWPSGSRAGCAGQLGRPSARRERSAVERRRDAGPTCGDARADAARPSRTPSSAASTSRSRA